MKFIQSMYINNIILTSGDGLQQALNTTEVLFGNPDALHRLSGTTKINNSGIVKKIIDTIILLCIIIGEELAQLFRDAPTTELPLSMLSTDEGGLTAAQLAVEIGAANSQCKPFFFDIECV